jgi:hypothetical protein
MATLGNLFDFGSTNMQSTARPDIGESSVQTAVNDLNTLGSSINQGLKTANSTQDEIAKMGKYSEREVLMAEIRKFLSGVPTDQFEIREMNGQQVSVPSDKLNSQLRQMSMKVMEYVSRTNDYEFAKMYDVLIGDFMQKGSSGMTANKMADVQNQQNAQNLAIEIGTLIKDAEDLYNKDGSYNSDNLAKIRTKMAQYQTLTKQNYPGSLPKFLADRIGWKNDQSQQLTGYKVEAINSANSAIRDWVSSRKGYVDKFRDVSNAINLLKKLKVTDASSLFSIVKLLSSIIEPGMAVTEGEVAGYMGNTAVTNWLTTINSVVKGFEETFNTSKPTLEEIRAKTRNIDSATAQTLKTLADTLGVEAIGNWKTASEMGLAGITGNIQNDVNNKYKDQLPAQDIKNIQDNIASRLVNGLGITSSNAPIENSVVADDTVKFEGNSKDSQIINGKDFKTRMSPFTARGDDGEIKSANGKTYKFNAENDNWERSLNPISDKIKSTKMKQKKPVENKKKVDVKPVFRKETLEEKKTRLRKALGLSK